MEPLPGRSRAGLPADRLAGGILPVSTRSTAVLGGLRRVPATLGNLTELRSLLLLVEAHTGSSPAIGLRPTTDLRPTTGLKPFTGLKPATGIFSLSSG